MELHDTGDGKRRMWTLTRASVLVLVLTGLSACTMIPTKHAGPVQPDNARLSAQFRHFLAQAPAGSSMVAAPTNPWWPGATVYAQKSYYAASGRTCRGLTVTTTGPSQHALVCHFDDGSWRQARALGGQTYMRAPRHAVRAK